MICSSNLNFTLISKWFTKNKFFHEMGKISDNDGVLRDNDRMWYDHIHRIRPVVTYDTNLNL